MAARQGYDEVNLNVGCPSDRVSRGRFGACLMAEPDLVARCVEAMARAAPLPVTVKTRIGIDRDESTERLETLVRAVREAGCATVVVHARNAWLDGLSPKENREIPPLRYAVVHALRRAQPGLQVVINGGLRSLGDCEAQLAHVDGVMVGREAYYNPWHLAQVDARLYGEDGAPASREAVAEAMAEYAARECAGGTPLAAITRHLLALYQGEPGARQWRRTLSEDVRRPGAGPGLILRALDAVRAAAAPAARAA